MNRQQLETKYAAWIAQPEQRVLRDQSDQSPEYLLTLDDELTISQSTWLINFSIDWEDMLRQEAMERQP